MSWPEAIVIIVCVIAFLIVFVVTVAYKNGQAQNDRLDALDRHRETWERDHGRS